MFEDSLMESAHTIKAKSKYWSVVGLFINSGLLLAFILWPLLHPEALPKQMMAALILAPPVPASAPPQVRSQLRSQPKMVSIDLMAVPSRIPKLMQSAQATETPMQGTVEGLDSNPSTGMDSVIGSTGATPAIVVRSAPRPENLRSLPG